jgi:hypothetical protein
MSDTKVFLSLMAPLRYCPTCFWQGVILTRAFFKNEGRTPVINFDVEHPSPLNPDLCKFCPVCGGPLKERT